jgi:hypothetical protein
VLTAEMPYWLLVSEYIRSVKRRKRDQHKRYAQNPIGWGFE